MGKPKINVDVKICLACGGCISVCPQDAMNMTGAKANVDKDKLIAFRDVEYPKVKMELEKLSTSWDPEIQDSLAVLFDKIDLFVHVIIFSAVLHCSQSRPIQK